MLECYEAYADQYVMAQRMQQMILNAADAIGAGRTIETANGTINLDGEWRWLSVYPGLSEAVGVEITPDTDASVLREIAQKHEVKIDPAWGAQKLVIELFGEIVEPTLIDPTFVCDYPPLAQPLARPHRSKPRSYRSLGPDHRRDGTRYRLLRARSTRSSSVSA